MDYTVDGILQARILEWIAYPFPGGPSQIRGGTQVSHIAGDSLPTKLSGKPNQGRSSQKSPEARWKGPEKLIKIRRSTT